MNINRIHILVLTLLLLGVAEFTFGAAVKETCLSKIKKLHSQKNIDLDKIYGEWMSVKLGYKNATLFPTTSTLTCLSQVISKGTTPKNMGIKSILITLSDNQRVEHTGQVTFPINEAGKWRWTNDGNLNQTWYSVILDTDYTSYMIQYRCEEDVRKDYFIETILLRHKQRNPPATRLNALQNKMVKYGVEAKNIVNIKQKC